MRTQFKVERKPSDVGLVFHNKLWEGTVFDYSLNGNICVATDTVIGEFGLEFNATTSNIDCGSASIIDNVFAGGGSISWWQRSDGVGEGTFGVALDKGNVWSVFMNNSTTQMAFLHTFSGNDYQSTFAVSSGVWQNIAIVYNNDTTTAEAAVHVNGAVVANSAGSPTTAADSDAATNLFVGNDSSGGFTWDGGLSDVRIHNKILSSADIKSLYELTRWRYHS